MLTCALRTQVKKLKIEIKNKFYIENVAFTTFKTLNARVPKKPFTSGFITYAPRAQVNIFQK